MSNADNHILMTVKGLMVDQASNVPIVILHSEESSRLLPIWIGVSEANAIAIQLEGIELPRPMTHDLTIALLRDVESEITKILISALEKNTFFAQIFLKSSTGESTVDSRPSDAIALALRSDAPIFVSAEVLDQAVKGVEGELSSDDDRLKKWLEEIDPEDLGKYTM